MGIGHVRMVLEAGGLEWRTPTHKLLAIVLAFECDRRGICRSTQGELADAVGVSKRHVVTVLDELCENDVAVRLGHGRYGIRYGLSEAEAKEQGSPSPKGVGVEYARLKAIIDAEKAVGPPKHKIVWGKDGMPKLGERS